MVMQMNEQEKLFLAAGEIHFYSALLLKFFNEALESRLRQQGAEISALQHGILSMLMYENLTISVISQRLGMDPSTLVRSVDRLERQGLVVRGRDPKDRRRNPISITEKGRELISAVPPITYEDLPFQALQTLGIDSTLQLRDLLRDLMNEFPEGRMIVSLISGYSPGQE
jgi:DNA-binding MarR family transcriptional regulator